MGRRRLPYGEGDWCAVPLQDGGYGLGLVARIDGRGGALGYFFGPRLEELPTLERAANARPEAAALVCMFGDLGLLNGEWPVLGRLPDWRREEWPVPVFGRVSRIGHWVQAWRIRYGDARLERLWDEPCAPSEAEDLPRDASSGYVAVQIHLSRRLGQSVEEGSTAPVRSTPIASGRQPDLFDDDVAADVRGDFGEALESGLAPSAAADRVLAVRREELRDPDDEPVIMLALASLLHEKGVSSHPVVTRARQVLVTGAGLERWREAGGEVLASRLRLYERIAARLG